MHSLLAKWSIVLHGLTFPKAEGSILVGDIFFILIIIRPNYEAYVSKYRLLYMVVSEPIKSFMGYLRKGNTGWELIHIPFCTLL